MCCVCMLRMSRPDAHGAAQRLPCLLCLPCARSFVVPELSQHPVFSAQQVYDLIETGEMLVVTVSVRSEDVNERERD